MHETFDKVYNDVVYCNTLMVCTIVDSGAPRKAKVNVQERGGSRHSSPSGEEQLSLERDSPLRATSTTRNEAVARNHGFSSAAEESNGLPYVQSVAQKQRAQIACTPKKHYAGEERLSCKVVLPHERRDRNNSGSNTHMRRGKHVSYSRRINNKFRRCII